MRTLNNIMFCVILVLLSSLSPGSWAAYENECQFTRYPSLCVQTLTGLPSTADRKYADILSALVDRTIAETTETPHSLSATLSSSEAHELAPTHALDYCHELMNMSLKRLNQARDLLQKSPEKHKADIQTWLSAALTFQQTCKDSIEHHALPNAYTNEIHTRMDYLSELVSNPLALVNRITRTPSGKSPAGWGRHLREGEGGFPRWVSAGDRRLLQSTGIKANAVVAKDGTGNFMTISAAIAAATGSRFVIYVKSGTYSEKINVKKDGITLVGEGKYSTVITGSSSVGGGADLRGSATFSVTGDGFIARDIGFQNTAGPEAGQAVALSVISDRSVLFRCSIAGYQDTLYAHSLRQFYRECDIYGTVDFIFGNAAAVFQSCNLILRRPRKGGAFVTILANGRTDPGQNTGFSVQNCKITVGSDFSPVKNSYDSYLGRPWKAYSRAVVMQSSIDGEISGRGWIEWEGSSGSTYRTLYFGEYANMGPGAATSGRVSWPGFHVIGTPEASKFTVASFIGGNMWLPSTGVAFDSGL